MSNAMTELADDLFPSHELLPETGSAKDAQITEYLVKLDSYSMLRASLQKRMGSGFIELSRAKYTGRDYGKDYWDMNVQARTEVLFNGKFALLTAGDKDVMKNDDEEVSLRHREKRGKPEHKDNKAQNNRSYDPINMFGVLVPPPLRLSQKEFQSSLNDIVELINLQRELDELAKRVESVEIYEKPEDKKAAEQPMVKEESKVAPTIESLGIEDEDDRPFILVRSKRAQKKSKRI